MSHTKKENRFQKVNVLILALHLFIPIWVYPLIFIPGISSNFFLIALFSSLLLGVVYKIVQKTNKGKLVILIARIITFSSIAFLYLPLLIMTSFSESKFFYQLKRYCYIQGVYSTNAEYYEKLLPKSLPESCNSYSYRTQGSFFAQDYHPSSYLIFYTDIQTQKKYASYYKNIYGEPITKNPANKTEDSISSSKHLVWFGQQMRLDDTYINAMNNYELYYISDYFPKGVLIDYDTGLVAILS